MSIDKITPEKQRWKDRFIQRLVASDITNDEANAYFNDKYGYKGEGVLVFHDPEKASDDLIHLITFGMINGY